MPPKDKGDQEIETACNTFRYVYSTIFLIFSIVIVIGLIFEEKTNLAEKVHPALAFVLMWSMIIWLSMVEGGQASFVGLVPVDMDLYKESHKVSYKCMKLINKGDNLDRYLMGRQFMVIFIVFLINLSGAPLADVELWGLPSFIIDVFLVGGFAMILTTAMVGQLQSQVNASLCMLDYINNYFAVFTLYVAMAIEWTGLMHFSYVIQLAVGLLARQPIESKEPPKTAVQQAFFWFRATFSLFALGCCFGVTLTALFNGQTTMWDGVPAGVAVFLFFLLMCVVGLLEGMQIAFFAVAKFRKEDRGDAKCSKMTCHLLFKGSGKNLPGFMIGRQLCVVSCFFVIARVTTIDVPEGDGNIWGVGDSLQKLFDTGLLGAVITTIVGSISWQLVASAFPFAFLANPLTYIFLRICLFLEFTGICSGAWVLAWLHKRFSNFQRDEVYIGTAEERAARAKGDHDIAVGPGHMAKLPVFAEDAPEALRELWENDPSVREYMESLHGVDPVKMESTAHSNSDEDVEIGTEGEGAEINRSFSA